MVALRICGESHFSTAVQSELYEMYGRMDDWAKADASKRVSHCCYIEANGFMGKSTFLREDLLSADAVWRYKDSYTFVMVDAQSEGKSRKKLDLMAEIRRKFNEQQVETPTLDWALSRYASLTNDTEFLDEVGIKQVSLVECVDQELQKLATSEAKKICKDTFLSILASMSIDVAVLGVPASELSSPEQVCAFSVGLAAQFSKNVAPAVIEAVKAYRLRYGELKEIFDVIEGLNGYQILSLLEGFLIVDLLFHLSKDEERTRHVLVFDSAEYIRRNDGHPIQNDSSWALSLAESPVVFTLFCGKDLSWLTESGVGDRVEFGDIDEDALLGYCVSRNIAKEESKKIGQFSCWSPALVRMLVDSMTVGDRVENLTSSRFASAFDRYKELIDHPESWTIEQAMNGILEHGLHGLSDSELDVLLRVCWFDSWSFEMLEHVMPEFIGNHPREYTSISSKSYSLDLGNGRHAVHPTFEICLRERCDDHIVQASLHDIERSRDGWEKTQFERDAVLAAASLAVAHLVNVCSGRDQ